jgi:hypothetical protein
MAPADYKREYTALLQEAATYKDIIKKLQWAKSGITILGNLKPNMVKLALFTESAPAAHVKFASDDGTQSIFATDPKQKRYTFFRWLPPEPDLEFLRMAVERELRIYNFSELDDFSPQSEYLDSMEEIATAVASALNTSADVPAGQTAASMKKGFAEWGTHAIYAKYSPEKIQMATLLMEGIAFPFLEVLKQIEAEVLAKKGISASSITSSTAPAVAGGGAGGAAGAAAGGGEGGGA